MSGVRRKVVSARALGIASDYIEALRAEMRDPKTPALRLPVIRAALGAACITRDLLLYGRSSALHLSPETLGELVDATHRTVPIPDGAT